METNKKKQAEKKIKEALNEAKKIEKFISKWQKENQYKRNELKQYNLKFRKDFTSFCKKNKISNKERDWYLGN